MASLIASRSLRSAFTAAEGRGGAKPPKALPGGGMGVRPKTEGGAGAAPPTVAAAPNGVNEDDGMNDAGVKAGCEGLG